MYTIVIVICTTLLLANVAASAPAVDGSANARADGINNHSSDSLYLIISLAPNFVIPAVPLVAISLAIILALVMLTFRGITTSIMDILRGIAKKCSSKRKYRESFTCRDASRVGRSSLHADEQSSPSKSTKLSFFSYYGGSHSSGFLELSEPEPRCVSEQIAHPEMAKLSPVEKKRMPSPVFPLPRLHQHSLAATRDHVP